VAKIPNDDGVQKAGANEDLVKSPRSKLTRRELLKGIAGGSAVVASATPIESLASNFTFVKNTHPTVPNRRCSVSGIQSAGASVAPPRNDCTCKGPSHYTTGGCSNWPGYNPSTGIATNVCNGITFTQYTKCKTLFPRYPNSTDTMYQCLSKGYDEQHWCTAVLNAIKSPAMGWNYPHTTTAVMNGYNGAGATYTNHIGFLKTVQIES
jgi:hypothetical protein